MAQHGEDFLVAGMQFRLQGLGDGRQGLAQVTITVDGIEQGQADAAVTRAEPEQVELRTQVVDQVLPGTAQAQGRRFALVFPVVAATGPGAVVGNPVIAAALAGIEGVTFRGRIAGHGHSGRFAGAGSSVLTGFFGPLQQGVGIDRLGQFQLQLGG